MICPKCGYLMSDLDTECVRCANLTKSQQAQAEAPPPQSAAAQSAPLPPTMMHCQICQHPISKTAKMCPSCGEEYSRPTIQQGNKPTAIVERQGKCGGQPHIRTWQKAVGVILGIAIAIAWGQIAWQHKLNHELDQRVENYDALLTKVKSEQDTDLPRGNDRLARRR